MSVTTDAAYTAGWATLTRVEAIPGYSSAVSDSHSPAGSAYWNLYNYLRVARGDQSVQGSAVTADQRNGILDANGDLWPGVKNQIVGWTGTLNSAFPAGAVTPTPTPAPGSGTVPLPNGAPFLGGILDGQIFGIPTKFLLIGLGAYFIFKD